jgi:hypothetical protein
MKKYFLFFILIVALMFSGCVDNRQHYKGINTNTQLCYDYYNENYDGMIDKYYQENIAECNNIETLESYQFKLKEMKQKDLISGQISGSYLLIGGSIYGTVEEKMYLVVTYYDPRINSYKITKFNLEQIEINTIGKNESAYFKYKIVPKNPYGSYQEFKETIGVLYLPEGWNII